VTDDFDKMAAVVDWLDTCRSRNLDALLDFYGDSATLECGCGGGHVNGRSGLADYWRPKLAGAARDAFELEEITPHGEGVALDYLSFDGKPVRIVFAFDAQGKISHMSCWPASR
jgi:ketosteroid isomerase-like protein